MQSAPQGKPAQRCSCTNEPQGRLNKYLVKHPPLTATDLVEGVVMLGIEIKQTSRASPIMVSMCCGHLTVLDDMRENSYLSFEFEPPNFATTKTLNAG